MSFQKAFVLFLSVLASANALATPLVVRAAHHHAIAARVAAPAPIEVPAMPLRKRQDGRRCRQRASSSLVASSSSTRPTATTNQEPLPTTAAVQAPPALAPTTRAQAPPAPAPTTRVQTTPAPAPTTTTRVQAPPPPATTRASGGNSNLPSFMVGTQTGQGTFYGTGLGACGIVNKDTDFIAAVSHLLFDNFPGYNGANPNNNPMCGQKVTATYKGKSVTVAVTDRCEGCALTDLDFSPSAFNQLADFGLGRISGVTWVWS